jgi:hypothetical protein
MNEKTEEINLFYTNLNVFFYKLSFHIYNENHTMIDKFIFEWKLLLAITSSLRKQIFAAAKMHMVLLTVENKA